MTWKPDIFIYHSPCDDGFGAAWAVWKRWGNAVEYAPCSYGDAPPEVAGKNVLVGDFSFKRAVLDGMAQTATSIVILDHHKTAQEDLAPFAVELCGSAALSPEDVPGMLRDLAELQRPPIVALFDMDKSGARLIWEFCHPDRPAPMLVQFVEDRDLWRFTFPTTKAFSLYLRSLPYDFIVWSDLAHQLEEEDELGRVLGAAEAIERFYNQKVAEMVGTYRYETIEGHQVPVVNCTWAFASDVAHELLIAHPKAPFAACYYDKPSARSYSLRSEDGRADVSAIAKRYGGGGHRNAAGFEVPLP